MDLTQSGVAAWSTLLGWLFTHALGKADRAAPARDGAARDGGFAERSRSWMDEWLLSKLVAGAFQDAGLDEGAAWWAVGTLKILIRHQRWHEATGQAHHVLTSWLRDGEVQQFLQVNRYRGELWFNHEAFTEFLGWMLTLAVVEISANNELAPEDVARQIGACYRTIEALRQAEEASEYRVDKLVEAARD
jgi:hypothetical protein